MDGPLRVRGWTLQDFEHSRLAWNSLLRDSDADPLFMCWEWQWHWWMHHAKSLRASLQLTGVYTTGGELVGIAPFYSHTARQRAIPLRRFELIGLEWRGVGGAFSEYLDVIARRDRADAVLAAVAHWLEQNGAWHDLAMPCLKPDSLAGRLARDYLSRFASVRHVDAIRAYEVRLPALFGEYVGRLRGSTRRKLLNQRSKLHDVQVETASVGQIGEYLETLRTLEALRWGKTSERLHRFNVDFAVSRARMGELRLTRLTAAGRTLSVMYDVRVNGTEYYLQSAFDPAHSHGLSLGYLHFGYAIEHACQDGVSRFDLLAGYGRERDYKQDLLANASTLVTCHVTRAPWLRALHRGYGLLRRGRERLTSAR
jgi:hypothetical protein